MHIMKVNGLSIMMHYPKIWTEAQGLRDQKMTWESSE